MIEVSPANTKTTSTARHSVLWKQFPGLVWSNSNATDSVMIRAALSRPKFEQLKEIAIELGLDRLGHEWGILDEENTKETQRARATVERILKNIKQGFQHAETGN